MPIGQGAGRTEIQALMPGKGRAQRRRLGAVGSRCAARGRAFRLAAFGRLGRAHAFDHGLYTARWASPMRMEAAARRVAARYPLLKLKLAGEGDGHEVAAKFAGARRTARLISRCERGLDRPRCRRRSHAPR